MVSRVANQQIDQMVSFFNDAIGSASDATASIAKRNQPGWNDVNAYASTFDLLEADGRRFW